jgi:hypothetical protein
MRDAVGADSVPKYIVWFADPSGVRNDIPTEPEFSITISFADVDAVTVPADPVWTCNEPSADVEAIPIPTFNSS